MITVGIVDGINTFSGTVRIIVPDLDDAVLDDIALLSSEQWFPEIQQPVVCLFTDQKQGFCLGPYFNESNLIYEANADLIIKKLDEDLIVTYDKKQKQLSVVATKPVTIKGDITIDGNLTVSGVISSGGAT